MKQITLWIKSCLIFFLSQTVFGQTPNAATQLPDIIVDVQTSTMTSAVKTTTPSQSDERTNNAKSTYTTTTAVDPNHLICSVFSGSFDLMSLTYKLIQYTTFKVQDSCNEAEFQKLTNTSITTQLKTIDSPPSLTLRGGAHRYLMDVNLSPVTKPYYYVGNLKFTPTGSINITLWEIIRKLSPNVQGVVTATYTPFNMQSQIHFIWDEGTLIHRLVSPEGKQYIMFGFTNNVVPSLTRDGLNDIGNLLNSPLGWKYENILLNKTVTVKTTAYSRFQASVMTDELQNFYIEYED